jgi:hypothetical protein
MEAICSTETSVATEQTTWRHIPEYDILHNHRCENLKSYNECFCFLIPFMQQLQLHDGVQCLSSNELYIQLLYLASYLGPSYISVPHIVKRNK